MEVRQLLKQFIISELMERNPETKTFDLEDTTPILEKGIINSLGILKLLAYIEETFKIEITDNDLIPENFETPEAITSLILSNIDS